MRSGATRAGSVQNMYVGEPGGRGVKGRKSVQKVGGSCKNCTSGSSEVGERAWKVKTRTSRNFGKTCMWSGGASWTKMCDAARGCTTALRNGLERERDDREKVKIGELVV